MLTALYPHRRTALYPEKNPQEPQPIEEAQDKFSHQPISTQQQCSLHRSSGDYDGQPTCTAAPWPIPDLWNNSPLFSENYAIVGHGARRSPHSIYPIQDHFFTENNKNK